MSDYCEKCGVPIVEGLTMCACDEEYCPDCGNIIDEWEVLVEKWDYLESIYKNDNMFQEMQNIINTVRCSE